MRRYLLSFTISLLVGGLVLVFWPLMQDRVTEFTPLTRDHPGAIGGGGWYLNFRRARTTQALDRDVLYQNIGHSIEHAREADIIVLGHSMVLFGLDWRTLQTFAEAHGIKIFNLASGGDTSGEFELRIVEKYQLHPKIWIINSDDHGTDFFSEYLGAGSGEAADVVSYGRIRGFMNTISKNLKWRIELLLRALLPDGVIGLLYPQAPIFNYRSAIHGNWNNDDWPGYRDQNTTMINTREPDCHAAPEVIEQAKKFVKRLGSGDIVLTLIPHSRSCRTRVLEIATALQATFVPVDWQKMTTFDGGGHLDAAGAKRFTAALLEQLEATPAFQQMMKAKSAPIANK